MYIASRQHHVSFHIEMLHGVPLPEAHMDGFKKRKYVDSLLELDQGVTHSPMPWPSS